MHSQVTENYAKNSIAPDATRLCASGCCPIGQGILPLYQKRAISAFQNEEVSNATRITIKPSRRIREFSSPRCFQHSQSIGRSGSKLFRTNFSRSFACGSNRTDEFANRSRIGRSIPNQSRPNRIIRFPRQNAVDTIGTPLAYNDPMGGAS